MSDVFVVTENALLGSSSGSPPKPPVSIPFPSLREADARDIGFYVGSFEVVYLYFTTTHLPKHIINIKSRKHTLVYDRDSYLIGEPTDSLNILDRVYYLLQFLDE